MLLEKKKKMIPLKYLSFNQKFVNAHSCLGLGINWLYTNTWKISIIRKVRQRNNWRQSSAVTFQRSRIIFYPYFNPQSPLLRFHFATMLIPVEKRTEVDTLIGFVMRLKRNYGINMHFHSVVVNRNIIILHNYT